MIEREIAWRVFAHEFNNSDYFFHEGDERAPNYLITPTGAKVNRLYFVGVLTEIDNIGVGEDMWRGRISDPTGAFMVYAGQYQPEAAVFLSGLDVPSFLAVVGKARAYEPEEGTIYTSVRPEELNTVDGALRDRWIVDTARLTLERISWVRTALGSGMKGEGLISMLVQSGAGAELAKNICKAIEHYPDLDQYLENLSGAVLDALRTVVPSNKPAVADPLEETPQDTPEIDAAAIDEETKIVRETPAEFEVAVDGPGPAHQNHVDTSEPEGPDAGEMIYELMGRLDTGKGVPIAELIEESKQCGLLEEQVDEAVKALMSEGKCYEPRIGLLRRV